MNKNSRPFVAHASKCAAVTVLVLSVERTEESNRSGSVAVTILVFEQSRVVVPSGLGGDRCASGASAFPFHEQVTMLAVVVPVSSSVCCETSRDGPAVHGATTFPSIECAA